MDKNFVELLLTSGKLKSVKRTGWVREKMPDPESVAEHTWRICFLILLLEDELEMNSDKLLRMAMIHDISEVVTGDLVTERWVNKVGDHNIREEDEIVNRLFSAIESGKKIYRLWQEQALESGDKKTRESDMLYQIGKIATVWQALEYEKSGVDPKKCEEWWENARKHVREPLLVSLLSEMEEYRRKL